jgi:hypothetical protein
MIAVDRNTVKQIFASVPLDPTAVWGVHERANGRNVGV